MSPSVLEDRRSGTHLANSLQKGGNMEWAHRRLGEGHGNEDEEPWMSPAKLWYHTSLCFCLSQ